MLTWLIVIKIIFLAFSVMFTITNTYEAMGTTTVERRDELIQAFAITGFVTFQWII